MFHRLFWGFTVLLLVSTRIAAQEPTSTASTAAATANFLLSPVLFGKDIPISAQNKVSRQLLNGLGAGGGLQDKFSIFTVMPSVTILEQVKIEEKQGQPMVKLNLRIQLSHLLTGDSLDVQDFTLSGTGTTTEECINRAFSPLRSQPIMLKAATNCRQKIADYYTKNCAAVISRAAAQAAFNNPTEAFVALHAIPAGYPCFAEGQASKNDYFQKAQSKECQQKLKQAGAAVFEQNIGAALWALTQIDAAAPCFAEAKAQIAVLESTADDALKKRYEWLFKFCKDGAQADVARSNAMNAWALGYLRDSGKPVVLK